MLTTFLYWTARFAAVVCVLTLVLIVVTGRDGWTELGVLALFGWIAMGTHVAVELRLDAEDAKDEPES